MVKEVKRNPFADPAIVAGYEAWYHTAGRQADQLEKELLKQLLASFPGAHSLLEVGCGTGHFPRWFEEQSLQVMNSITAQLSVYPLKQASLSPAIDTTLRILREHELEVEAGVMSSLVSREETEVFAALQEVFRQIAGQGSVVMVATFSNTCPLPGETEEAVT